MGAEPIPSWAGLGVWLAIITFALLAIGLAAATLWPSRAKEKTMRVPRVGDDVLYVLEDGRSAGEVRPAKIVRVWGSEPESACQLAVFVDASNDFENFDVDRATGEMSVLWKTSRLQSEDSKRGTWHFPEAVTAYPGAAISGEMTNS